MEKYERLKQMKPTVFKRLVGVKIETFKEMLETYSEYKTNKKKLGGRPSRLSLVEKALIQSGKFSLEGKKALNEDEGIELKYVLIDATECSVQRLKKATSMLQWKEKAAYSKRTNCD